MLIDHNNAYIVVVVDSYFGFSTLHAAQLTTKSNSERTWNKSELFQSLLFTFSQMLILPSKAQHLSSYIFKHKPVLMEWLQ